MALMTRTGAEAHRIVGEFARTVVALPLQDFLSAVAREAKHRDISISEGGYATLSRMHQEFHAARRAQEEERQRALVQYVRGPVRDRHKLVVPMVVKAKPTFKKARPSLRDFPEDHPYHLPIARLR